MKPLEETFSTIDDFFNNGKINDIEKILDSLQTDHPRLNLYKTRILRIAGESDKARDLALSTLSEMMEPSLNRTEILLELIYVNWMGGKIREAGNYTRDVDLFLSSQEKNQTIADHEIWRILGLYYHLKVLIGYSWTDESYLNNWLLESIKFREKLGDKFNLALGYNNLGVAYWYSDQLTDALKFMTKAQELNKDLGNFVNYTQNLENKIGVALQMNNTALAKEFMEQIEVVALDPKYASNKYIKLYHQFALGNILVRSQRMKDRVDAEEKFLWVINGELTHPQYFEYSIFNLVNLYLFEYKALENSDRLKDIMRLIAQLISFGDEQNIQSIIFKAKLLQAKLFLLQGKFTSAKDMLVSLNNEAANLGDKRLEAFISIELDKLLDLEIRFGSLDEMSSISDRMDILGLEEVIKNFSNNSYVIKKGVSETPVALIISNDVGVEIYSKIFDHEVEINQSLISNFLTAINIFANEAFGVKGGYIERIKHNAYIITMKKQESIVFSYIFRGESNLAVKKINDIIKKLSPEFYESASTDGFAITTSAINDTIDTVVTEVFSES